MKIKLPTLNQQDRVLLAYSGGVDSQVLLHLLHQHQQRHGFSLRAIHVHHGLQADADAWVLFCQQTCAQYQVPLAVEYIQVSAGNTEADAREKRYQVLAKHLQHQEIVMTAHHKNDSAETFLLQAFRGAGVLGLAAIAENKAFISGHIHRPLLSVSKSELLAYAKQHQLKWVEDRSNADVSYQRNWLRHEILPMLQAREPAVVDNLARAAEHCAEASSLLQEFAYQDLAALKICLPSENAREIKLSIQALATLSEQRIKNVIRTVLLHCHWPLPSQVKLQQLLREVMLARVDATPLLQWADVLVMRYQDDLVLYRDQITVPQHAINWDLTQDLYIKALDLTLELAEVEKVLQQKGLNPACATIAWRQGGERIRLQGKTHSQSLKKLLQAWRVPPWLRAGLPLLIVDDVLLAIWFDGQWIY